MFGFTDFWIGIVYLSTILAGVTCVVYGIFNWNRGDQALTDVDKNWAIEEKIIEKEME